MSAWVLSWGSIWRRLRSPDGVSVLSGATVAVGSNPVALAYAGHQFAFYAPSLGDGRALLMGEVIDSAGARWEVHLKGVGCDAVCALG
jgi:serine/tyrosine/threonine adenylyltransferase